MREQQILLNSHRWISTRAEAEASSRGGGSAGERERVLDQRPMRCRLGDSTPNMRSWLHPSSLPLDSSRSSYPFHHTH